jgi:class 3 adenylate cyclase
MRGRSSIDAVAAAARDEALDFGGMSSPDGAITLLFSDIEDSTGLEERLGERRWAELVGDHGALVRRLVEQHGGSLVKAEDDACMCSFASAHAGLRCAIEMQQTFAGQPLPEAGGSLPVRVGLHSGFVIADASDFYGRNVVLAARIADRARGGEILVSAAIREYTGSDPSFTFEPRGEQHFKGLLGEHAVYAVDWSKGGA